MAIDKDPLQVSPRSADQELSGCRHGPRSRQRRLESPVAHMKADTVIEQAPRSLSAAANTLRRVRERAPRMGAQRGRARRRRRPVLRARCRACSRWRSLHLPWWLVAICLCGRRALRGPRALPPRRPLVLARRHPARLRVALLQRQGVVLACLLGSAIVWVLDRRLPPIKFVFNLAQFALTTSIAVLVLHAVGARQRRHGSPDVDRRRAGHPGRGRGGHPPDRGRHLPLRGPGEAGHDRPHVLDGCGRHAQQHQPRPVRRRADRR